MNTFVETIRHYTLADGDYVPLLRFCIEAAVNLMLSFPDIEKGADGRYIPYEFRESPEGSGHTGKKLFFGNRSCGIEVTILPDVAEYDSTADSSDVITAETYGLSDRQSVRVECIRYAGEPLCNRVLELELAVPDDMAELLTGMFMKTFEDISPEADKLNAVTQSGMKRLSEKRFEDAADDAEYVLKFRPDDVESLMILGIACGATGDWRGAKKNFLKVVERSPDNYGAWYNLGLAYRSGSDNRSALHCFDRVLETDPHNHAAYFMKGRIFEETGREDEAVESFRYAVKFSPAPGDAWMDRGMNYTGEASEALARLGFPWRGDEELPVPDGIDLNEDIMHAASAGDVRRISGLIKRGASPDHRSSDIGMHGRTPLIVAAINGHAGAVKYLLEHGADIHFTDSGGCGVLGSVVEWGVDREMVRLLIEAGADANGRDPYGRPILLNNRSLNDPEMLELLVSSGADINAVDECGANGLLCAAAYGTTNAARFFIEHGLDVNSINGSGHTALMAAAGAKNIELMKLLIEEGADLNASNSEGKTALIYSIDYADAVITAMLVAAGTDVNARDNLGRSAIDILMEYGRRDDMEAFRRCIDILVSAGAELVRED